MSIRLDDRRLTPIKLVISFSRTKLLIRVSWAKSAESIAILAGAFGVDAFPRSPLASCAFAESRAVLIRVKDGASWASLLTVFLAFSLISVSRILLRKRLIWETRLLFCSVRSRSATGLGSSLPTSAELFTVSENPSDQKHRTHAGWATSIAFSLSSTAVIRALISWPSR